MADPMPQLNPEMGEEFSGHATEPIAIVGMGCRFPGDVQDASGLWQLLKNKQTGYRQFGDHRFSNEGFYHPDPGQPGTMATRGGFLLAEDPRLFDSSFFNVTPSEFTAHVFRIIAEDVHHALVPERARI
ncbi:beta-ketoacyl synthase [Hypoxylon sp. FL1150]|nr:beta-ketoacyl synthase [Hypoxylon sp. FL1150]